MPARFIFTLTLCLLASFGHSFASRMNLTFSVVKKGDPQYQFSSIAFGNNTLVVCGNVSSFASTNGVDWQLLPMTGGSVIYAAGRFVVANGSFWTSTDGFNWRSTLADDGPNNVAYGNGVFVANGRSSLYYSFDAEHWTRLPQQGGTTFMGVEYGNGLFITYGTYLMFPNPTPGIVIGYSTNGTNWSIGSPGQQNYIFPSTFAWGNFYSATATSPDGINITPWSAFSQSQFVKYVGNRLIGFRSDSPDVIISASEGFDNLNRPLGRYQYTTGVTNHLNAAAFDGSEYYFVGAGEIILKTKGVPPPATLTFGKIEDQTVTLGVTGVPGMTYGLQTIGNDAGVLPQLGSNSILDFTLDGPTTNITAPLYVFGAIYRLVER